MYVCVRAYFSPSVFVIQATEQGEGEGEEEGVREGVREGRERGERGSERKGGTMPEPNHFYPLRSTHTAVEQAVVPFSTQPSSSEVRTG